MLPIQQAIMPITGNRTGEKKTHRAGVVIHYTASPGRGAGAWGHKSYVTRKGVRVNGKMYEVDAKGNANTSRPFTWGAAHYYVDDKNIVQYIPSDEYAPHAGADTYMAGIEDKIGGSPNYCLDGIEICINPESDFQTAVDNAAQLAAYILKKDGLGIDRLFRHYDITGKLCPAMMINQSTWNSMKSELDRIAKTEVTWLEYYPWANFVAKVKEYMGSNNDIAVKPYNGTMKVTASALNLRDYPVSGKVIATMPKEAVVKATSVVDGWYVVTYNGVTGYASGSYLEAVTASKAQGTPIMGKQVATADQLYSYALIHNKEPKISVPLYELCKIFLEEGEAEGVRGDIAFCQSCKETAFFAFTGLARPEWNNYSGLGVTGQIGTDGVPVGNKFPDARTGVRAQIQHLKAYASTEPLKQACVDSRFSDVKRGRAPVWEYLGRDENPDNAFRATDDRQGWAVPGVTYGHDIVKMFAEVLKQPVEIASLHEKEVTVYVNGEKVEFPGVKPKVSDGSTYAPLKEIFVQMGWAVVWDSTSSTARFINPEGTIIVSVNSHGDVSITRIEKNPAIVYFEEGRTCGQLRPLFEALGFSIKWDGEKNGASINK